MNEPKVPIVMLVKMLDKPLRSISYDLASVYLPYFDGYLDYDQSRQFRAVISHRVWGTGLTFQS